MQRKEQVSSPLTLEINQKDLCYQAIRPQTYATNLPDKYRQQQCTPWLCVP